MVGTLPFNYVYPVTEKTKVKNVSEKDSISKEVMVLDSKPKCHLQKASLNQNILYHEMSYVTVLEDVF